MKDSTFFGLLSFAFVCLIVSIGVVLSFSADADSYPVHLPSPSWDKPELGGDPDAYRTPYRNPDPVCPGPNCPN